MVGIINVQRGVEVQVCASSSPLLIELTKKKSWFRHSDKYLPPTSNELCNTSIGMTQYFNFGRC